MSTQQPVDAAGEIAARLVEARGGVEPSLPWLTEVVRQFSLVEFDVMFRREVENSTARRRAAEDHVGGIRPRLVTDREEWSRRRRRR